MNPDVSRPLGDHRALTSGDLTTTGVRRLSFASGAGCRLGANGQVTINPDDPPAGSFYYFVIVGQDFNEGSYGKDS